MASFFERTGLPKALTWGYLGVLIFMMGDGIEQTWLSRYITDAGFNAAELFSVYGITVGVSAWLSGVIAETWGVKRTMLAGFILYVIGVAGFASIGMAKMNYPVLLATYAVKGLGYPLFAYTFMVWITYRVEKKVLSSAQGWFWFVFTGGLNVLGAYFGIFAKEHFGVIPTLWTAVLFAAIGAVLALWVNKCGGNNLFTDQVSSGGFRELLRGLGIMKREPKVLMGGIVRVINTTSQFAFVVFMPLYMAQYGMTDGQWASIWGSIFVMNILFNLIFGIVGDKFGWNRTVVWFGGVGCAVTVLLFYYSPQILNQYWFILLCGALWCIMLAGYVPLSALVPSLVEKDKGAAVSVLNLGAGAAAFVGPALVRLLEKPIGYEGIAWTLSALYIVSAVMTHFIRPSAPAGE
jgi:polyol permease family